MARPPVHVQLRDLDMMADYVAALGKEQFAAQYPGWYLIPMGLLSDEQPPSDEPPAGLATPPVSVDTASLKLGGSPRHSLGQPHPLAGCVFQFPGPEEQQLIVGRGEQCQICVPDETVSEEHCQLEVAAKGLLVTDLGSRNGTAINLERLQGDQLKLLSDGDMLTIGRYSFQLLEAETFYSTLALIRALDVP